MLLKIKRTTGGYLLSLANTQYDVHDYVVLELINRTAVYIPVKTSKDEAILDIKAIIVHQNKEKRQAIIYI